MVLRVLAVPLPVPPAGPPTGEQELQESLLWWVTTESFIFVLFKNRRESIEQIYFLHTALEHHQ